MKFVCYSKVQQIKTNLQKYFHPSSCLCAMPKAKKGQQKVPILSTRRQGLASFGVLTLRHAHNISSIKFITVFTYSKAKTSEIARYTQF